MVEKENNMKTKWVKKAVMLASAATMLVGIAACGNSKAHSTSTSVAASSKTHDGEVTMAQAFEKGTSIWYLSAQPSENARISQAFYFHGGEVTVFQYVGDDNLTYHDVENETTSQIVQTLYQYDRAGWNNAFPDTSYTIPQATKFSFEIHTDDSGKMTTEETLIDKSVIDPVDGPRSMIEANQNSDYEDPQGDSLYLPLVTIKDVNKVSQMGKLPDNFSIDGQRYDGYANWNTVVGNVVQDIQLSNESIDADRGYMVTAVPSSVKGYILDAPKTDGIKTTGKISLSYCLQKNTRTA